MTFKLILCDERGGISLLLINTELDTVVIVVMSLHEFNFESSILALISLCVA